jgi:hypothetical protein
LLIVACSGTAGCAHLPSTGSLAALLSPRNEVATSDVASCTVELRHGGRKPKTIDVPLGKDTRVQDVLDLSRASTRFRNLDVYVLRPTPHGPDPAVKMNCYFDRKQRRITLETDYAVLPGDRIVVGENRSSQFDNIVGSVVGPVLSNR